MIDWGSVPDWFAAVGTVGALFVAVITAKTAWEQVQQQRKVSEKRDDDDRAAAIRREAEGVSWWITRDGPTWDSIARLDGEDTSPPPTGSREIVNSDGVDVPFDNEAVLWVTLTMQNDNTTAVKHVVFLNDDSGQECYLGTLQPGRSTVMVPARGAGMGSTRGRGIARVEDGAPIAWVEFVDTRGVVWRRHRTDGLKSLDKSPENGQDYVY